MKNIHTVRRLVLAGLALLFALAPAAAQNKKIVLASLEWPPYVGAALPDQGASAVIAKAAFKAMGYDLTVEFYPWSRAVKLAKDDVRIMGYFPEYYSDEVAKEFIFSQPAGSSPLGFVESAANPITWKTLDDLVKWAPIGVVQDYVNTTDLDNRIAKGTLKAEVVASDELNIDKVAKGRLKLAVIDKLVLDYLLKTTPRLKDSAKLVKFNAKMLEDKGLYICFKNNNLGKQMAEIYNAGLKKIDIKKLMAEALAK